MNFRITDGLVLISLAVLAIIMIDLLLPPGPRKL